MTITDEDTFSPFNTITIQYHIVVVVLTDSTAQFSKGFGASILRVPFSCKSYVCILAFEIPRDSL